MNNRHREETREKVIGLIEKGFQCSQLFLVLFLEHQGKSNPDLLRAADSLQGGLGYAGKNCGVLTSGALALGLYVGHGREDERPHEDLIPLVLQLTDWFEEKFGSIFGGINCEEITNMSFDDEMPMSEVCTNMVVETYLKLASLLEDYGMDLRKGRMSA